MRKFLMASMLVGSVAAGAGEANSDERGDIALAGRAIAEIKAQAEADKRAYARAVKAIIGTHEGKEKYEGCFSKDLSYWRRCVVGWEYEAAYKFLYEKFYEEELEK
ncbi:MAG: hypothetical protein OXC28_05015 [Defluviicoccus sp.]|nr:hypothetical protein [Defluviicoccus sp.]